MKVLPLGVLLNRGFCNGYGRETELWPFCQPTKRIQLKTTRMFSTNFISKKVGFLLIHGNNIQNIVCIYG